MNSLYNDGGRLYAGFKPHHLYKGPPPGDCVVRAIAIACDLDYRKVNTFMKALFREHDKKVRLKDPLAFTQYQAHRFGAQSGVPNYISIPFLKALGFLKLPQPSGIKRVSCLARREPRAPMARLGFPWTPPEPADRLAFPGSYIVSIREHMACVRDGDLHDLLDCRNERVYTTYARRLEMSEELKDYFGC